VVVSGPQTLDMGVVVLESGLSSLRSNASGQSSVVSGQPVEAGGQWSKGSEVSGQRSVGSLNAEWRMRNGKNREASEQKSESGKRLAEGGAGCEMWIGECGFRIARVRDFQSPASRRLSASKSDGEFKDVGTTCEDESEADY
jgi:hypothetical protein